VANDPYGLRRIIVTIGISLALGVLELSGITAKYTACAVAGILGAVGSWSVRYEPQNVIYVVSEAYDVMWYCTPSVLSSCGIVLVWFARQSTICYCITVSAHQHHEHHSGGRGCVRGLDSAG